MGTQSLTVLVEPNSVEPLLDELLVLSVLEGKKPYSLIEDLTRAENIDTLGPEGFRVAQIVDLAEFKSSLVIEKVFSAYVVQNLFFSSFLNEVVEVMNILLVNLSVADNVKLVEGASCSDLSVD